MRGSPARCRAWRRSGSRGRAAGRRCRDAPALSESVTVMNTVPARRQRARRPRPAPWRTPSGSRAAMPMTSPVERISGPSSASAPAKRSNGSTASLTETWSPAHRVLGQVEVGEPLAEHEPAGDLGQRHADRLGDERHGPRRARVGLDHVERRRRATAYWTLMQPDDAERRARCRAVARADLVEHLAAERVRRQHAGAVAGVDAGLLDVLHDPADPDLLAVAQRVDVDLDRVLEEAVEEDLACRRAVRRRRAQVVGAGRRA